MAKKPWDEHPYPEPTAMAISQFAESVNNVAKSLDKLAEVWRHQVKLEAHKHCKENSLGPESVIRSADHQSSRDAAADDTSGIDPERSERMGCDSQSGS